MNEDSEEKTEDMEVDYNCLIVNDENIHYQPTDLDFIEIRSIPNEAKGDSSDRKDKKDFRLVSQNINGLSSKTLDKWKATIERIDLLEADVVGLTKTCVNWNINSTNKIYSNILQKKFKQSTLTTSKIANKMNKKIYLPGGTLSLTANKMVNRIESDIQDKYGMGRWTGTTYQLGNNKKLNVITAYRVIDSKITTKNVLSTNSQQYYLLKERDIDAKPRKQFIEDFCKQFKEMFLDTNQYSIVMIDANENIQEPEPGGIIDMLDELNIVNLYYKKHQDYEEFPTHNTGSKTIDYLLETTNVLPFVKKLGYLKFHEYFD